MREISSRGLWPKSAILRDGDLGYPALHIRSIVLVNVVGRDANRYFYIDETTLRIGKFEAECPLPLLEALADQLKDARAAGRLQVTEPIQLTGWPQAKKES